MKRIVHSAAVIAALTLASGARAQTPQAAMGPRWLGLLGCWSIAQSGSARDAQLDGRVVCITPTADANVAEISAIVGGKVMTRDRLDAGGLAYPLSSPGCSGSQHAAWSADQRRVFLNSAITCEGTTTSMSALLALTASGDWIDVRRIQAGNAAPEIHVARYRDVGLTRDVPVDIATTLRGYAMSIETGRIAASVPIGTSAIIEASRRTDSSLVAAWVTATGQRFAFGEREWRELAEAGVSASVRDSLGDAVNPASRRASGHFEEYGRWSRQASASWDQGTGQRLVFPRTQLLDPWGYGVGLGIWTYGFGYGYLQPFMYGLGYGEPMGFDNALGYLFGYRRSVTGYVRPPVLVLKNTAATGAQGQSLSPAIDPKGDDTNAKAAAARGTGDKGGSGNSAPRGRP